MSGSFTDQLNIETPEQVELQFPVAGVGSRFLALLADTLIQVGTLLVLGIVFGVFAGAARRHEVAKLSSSGERWALAVVVLFLFLLFWGYFSLFEAFWHGQTPGKRLLKIRVIKDSGRQVTLFEAMARNLLRIVDMQLSYLVGVISMLCNRQQKRLGDLVAGTMVVHERAEEQPLLGWTGQGPEPSLRGDGVAADAVGRLGAADLQVLEAFFARALDLPVETRAAMGQRVADQLAARMGVSAPGQDEVEGFLRSVAFAIRSQGSAWGRSGKGRR